MYMYFKETVTGYKILVNIIKHLINAMGVPLLVSSFACTFSCLSGCCCRSGDVIELINTGSDDWWKGSIGEQKGYFPASYVQV